MGNSMEHVPVNITDIFSIDLLMGLNMSVFCLMI